MINTIKRKRKLDKIPNLVANRRDLQEICQYILWEGRYISVPTKHGNDQTYWVLAPTIMDYSGPNWMEAIVVVHYRMI